MDTCRCYHCTRGKVKFGSTSVNADVYVVDVPNGAPLLGIDLIKALDQHIRGSKVVVQLVNTTNSEAKLEDSGIVSQLKEEFPNLFSASLGKAGYFFPLYQNATRRTASCSEAAKTAIFSSGQASEWVS